MAQKTMRQAKMPPSPEEVRAKETLSPEEKVAVVLGYGRTMAYRLDDELMKKFELENSSGFIEVGESEPSKRSGRSTGVVNKGEVVSKQAKTLRDRGRVSANERLCRYKAKRP